jgi:hypothetical protein
MRISGLINSDLEQGPAQQADSKGRKKTVRKKEK